MISTTSVSPVTARLGWAAAIWAFVFASTSFYWAVGGRTGASTLGDTIEGLTNNSWFTAILWITGILKVAAGVLALMLTSPPKQYFRYWLIKSGVWVTGFVLALYGGANLAVRALMATGLMSTPDAMHSPAAYWHLLLWDPWWLLGGMLFLGVAWSSHRAPATRHTPL